MVQGGVQNKRECHSWLAGCKMMSEHVSFCIACTRNDSIGDRIHIAFNARYLSTTDSSSYFRWCIYSAMPKSQYGLRTSRELWGPLKSVEWGINDIQAKCIGDQC